MSSAKKRKKTGDIEGTFKIKYDRKISTDFSIWTFCSHAIIEPTARLSEFKFLYVH